MGGHIMHTWPNICVAGHIGNNLRMLVTVEESKLNQALDRIEPQLIGAEAIAAYQHNIAAAAPSGGDWQGYQDDILFYGLIMQGLCPHFYRINIHHELANSIWDFSQQSRQKFFDTPQCSKTQLNTYAYQWADWNSGVDSQGLGESTLVLDTFANGYLMQLREYEDDHENKKPVDALILVMQVVKKEVHLTSAATLDEEDEDPDSNFIMDFDYFSRELKSDPSALRADLTPLRVMYLAEGTLDDIDSCGDFGLTIVYAHSNRLVDTGLESLDALPIGNRLWLEKSLSAFFPQYACGRQDLIAGSSNINAETLGAIHEGGS
ncbi:hypothetical protein F5887DRAFT_917335 [Amanita rubescens]|nr:hypothetical protein F5887DRAFT_917335 [Amanita rubescens]